VTPPTEGFLFAFWPARGDLIYTLSAHAPGGNLRFLDAQKLDPASKRPIGDPVTVYQFSDNLVPGMDPVWNNVARDENRIILELGGISTDVWIR